LLFNRAKPIPVFFVEIAPFSVIMKATPISRAPSTDRHKGNDCQQSADNSKSDGNPEKHTRFGLLLG
jgi:hypothetical protein